jgi:hypothetical protein
MSLCKEKVVDFIASQALASSLNTPTSPAQGAIAQQISASVTDTNDFVIGGNLFLSRQAICPRGNDVGSSYYLPITILSETGLTYKYLLPLSQLTDPC